MIGRRSLQFGLLGHVLSLLGLRDALSVAQLIGVTMRQELLSHDDHAHLHDVPLDSWLWPCLGEREAMVSLFAWHPRLHCFAVLP